MRLLINGRRVGLEQPPGVVTPGPTDRDETPSPRGSPQPKVDIACPQVTPRQVETAKREQLSVDVEFRNLTNTTQVIDYVLEFEGNFLGDFTVRVPPNDTVFQTKRVVVNAPSNLVGQSAPVTLKQQFGLKREITCGQVEVTRGVGASGIGAFEVDGRIVEIPRTVDVSEGFTMTGVIKNNGSRSNDFQLGVQLGDQVFRGDSILLLPDMQETVDVRVPGGALNTRSGDRRLRFLWFQDGRRVVLGQTRVTVVDRTRDRDQDQDQGFQFELFLKNVCPPCWVFLQALQGSPTNQ